MRRRKTSRSPPSYESHYPLSNPQRPLDDPPPEYVAPYCSKWDNDEKMCGTFDKCTWHKNKCYNKSLLKVLTKFIARKRNIKRVLKGTINKNIKNETLFNNVINLDDILNNEEKNKVKLAYKNLNYDVNNNDIHKNKNINNEQQQLWLDAWDQGDTVKVNNRNYKRLQSIIKNMSAGFSSLGWLVGGLVGITFNSLIYLLKGIPKATSVSLGVLYNIFNALVVILTFFSKMSLTVGGGTFNFLYNSTQALYNLITNIVSREEVNEVYIPEYIL